MMFLVGVVLTAAFYCYLAKTIIVIENKLATLQKLVDTQDHSLQSAYSRIRALAQYLGVEGSYLSNDYRYSKPKKVRKS